MKFNDLKRGVIIRWKRHPEFIGMIVSEKLFHRAKKRRDDYEYYEYLVMNIEGKRDIPENIQSRNVANGTYIAGEVIRQQLRKDMMRADVYIEKDQEKVSKYQKQLFVGLL